MQEGLGNAQQKFYHEEQGPETAILVGLITPNQNERKTQEYLDELEFLATTAGALTVRRFTQRLRTAHTQGRDADAFRLHGFLGPACELLACDR